MIPLPGGAWCLDGDEMVLMAQCALAGRPRVEAGWTANAIPVPPRFAGLMAEAQARVDERRSLVAAQRSAACSADVPKRAPAPSAVAGCRRLITTGEAADLLGVTERAVRGLCRRGTLPAQQDESGAWLIDEDAVKSRAQRQTQRRQRGRDHATGDAATAA